MFLCMYVCLCSHVLVKCLTHSSPAERAAIIEEVCLKDDRFVLFPLHAAFSQSMIYCVMQYNCWISYRPYLTLDLSSSRIHQMDALGHTLTPFCSVCHQFFGFIPRDVHVLQVSSDDVHPIFPWTSRLSLVAPQFPSSSLTKYSGVLHS